MKVNERAYQKLLSHKPYVVAGKEAAFLDILWKIRTNGYLKPINYGGR